MAAQAPTDLVKEATLNEVQTIISEEEEKAYLSPVFDSKYASQDYSISVSANAG